jgi:hypothetical protein
MATVSTNLRKSKKKSNDGANKDIVYVNERLQKNYGKTNKEVPETQSVEPGVQDTPAVKALRSGANSTVEKKIKITPSGRPSGESYGLQKMREKGILDANNKVIPKEKRIRVVSKKSKSY